MLLPYPRHARSWVAVIALTVMVTAISTRQSFTRYEEFRSGWSWDLAYYNQWFWAMTRGSGVITVRPLAAYAQDGPSVWKMNYLSPLRFVLVPIYALFPGPRTLLVIQNVMFWWVVAAAYTLVRAESKSEWLSLSAAALVPLTPLAWPLAWNDFRELQVAMPFVLWAVQGWRQRRPDVAGFGIVGMLACRQEYAFVVMLLPLLPPQQVETPDRRFAWSATVVLVGFAWFFFAFLGYLSWRVGPHAAADYVTQFAGATGSSRETLATAIDLLLVGLASWVVFALFAPRVMLLALPWVWSVSNGRFALQWIRATEWHHVRYAAPATALVLAAGLVGYARAGTLLSRRIPTRWPLVALCSVTAVGLIAGNVLLQKRMSQLPRVISPEESVRLWSWIDRVEPADGVLAGYEVAAPLSSRQWLYSYRLDENKPQGYPRLLPAIRWAFVRTGEVAPRIFLDQGFVEVSSGPAIQVFRR